MTDPPIQTVPARFIDQWLQPTGQAAQALTAAVLALLSKQAPVVKRRSDQLESWHALLECLVANLTLSVLDRKRNRKAPEIVVPLFQLIKGPRRYAGPCSGKAVRRALEDLATAGLAEVEIGDQGTMRGRKATSIRPAPAFARLVRAHRVSRGDLALSAARHDPLVLRLKRLSGDPDGPDQWEDYQDTYETDWMRQEVETINAHLMTLDIRWAGTPPDEVDLRDRFMSRRFTVLKGQRQRFDQGGRLFGGFWQRLPKRHRQALLLQGEPVAVVDFNAMFARIALALADTPAPAGDLYAIPGLEALTRPQIKAALNALMFVLPGTSQAWPKAFFMPEDQGGKGLPSFPRHLGREAVRAIVANHLPGLAGGLNVGATEGAIPAGYRIMFTESQIMVRILLACQERGLAALPIHDGLLVPSSTAQEVLGLMTATAAQVTGYALPATLTEPSL